MSTRRTFKVRGVVLLFVLLLGVFFVLIGFLLISIDFSNVYRSLFSSTLRCDDDCEKQLQKGLDNGEAGHREGLTSTDDKELLSPTTDRLSETGAHHLTSSQYGSLSATTSVPQSSSVGQPSDSDARLFQSATPTTVYQSEMNSTEFLYDRNDNFTGNDVDLAEISSEKNNVTLSNIVPYGPQSAKTTSTVAIPESTATLLQSAAVFNEPFRAYQRIPVQLKIPPYVFSITNLLIPEIVHKPSSVKAVFGSQSTTSTTPAYARVYDISGVTKQLVKTTPTIPLYAKSYVPPLKSTTSPTVNPVTPVMNVVVKKTSDRPSGRTAPPYASTTTMNSGLTWLNKSTTRYQERRITPNFDGTAMPLLGVRGESHSANDYQFEKERAYSPKPAHSISSTGSLDPSADDWQVDIWDIRQSYALSHPHITTTSKPQRPSLPAQQLNEKITLSNDRNIPEKFPGEVERDGMNLGLKASVSTTSPLKSSNLSVSYPKHKQPSNLTNQLQSRFQKQYDTYSKDDDRLNHSYHWQSEETQTDSRKTTHPWRAYLSDYQTSVADSRVSDELQQTAKHQEHYGDHDRSASPFVPIVAYNSPVAVEKSIGSPISTHSTEVENNHIMPTDKRVPLLQHGFDEHIPASVLFTPKPPVRKNASLDENVLTSRTSKLEPDEQMKSNDRIHSFEGGDSKSDGKSIEPHKLTVSVTHDKVDHHHRHEHHYYSYDSPVLVTALMDIGRGKWTKYTRTYEQYMSYLKNLLTLRNRIVIFTDHRGAEFVRQKRHNSNTQIIEVTMREIPLYRYRDEMAQILNFEQQNWKYDEKTRDKPEAKSADYDVLVNSKPYFLYNATQSSRFRANALQYVWIDAGYGHGDQSKVPLHCHWKPTFANNVITVIKLTPEHDKISKYSINDLYRVDWSVVSGGFLAGDATTINRFYRFYHKTFLDLLDARKVDDDQTVLTLTMKNYESLFNVIHSKGDWFALFRLFPCS